MKIPAAILLALGIVLAAASPAAADPPKPTDYHTAVVSIEPPVDGLTVRLLGGDSFVELRAPHGVAVEVIGYKGEAFLRFHPDGTVEEDVASYTSRTSKTRYGSNLTAEVSATTDWRVVAHDGVRLWHDHRSHWMSPQPPLGLHPGDQVLDGVIPLVVDGRPVAVHLATFWVGAPAVWPTWLAAGAAGLGLALIEVVAHLRRRRVSARGWASLAGLGASAALVVGVATRLAMPAAAGTSRVHWVLPAIALALTCTALIVPRRSPSGATSCIVVAAVALVEWAWWRRAVFTKPVLPTVLAPELDRTITAMVLVVAAAVALVGVARIARPAIFDRFEDVRA